MLKRFLSEQTTKRMLITIFIALGLLLIGLRWLFFDANQVPSEDTAWKISLKGRFEVTKGVSILNSLKPQANRHIRLISQKVYHPKFKIIPNVDLSPRRVHAKARASGNAEILYEYLVQLSRSPLPIANLKSTLTTEEREHYLLPVAGLDLTVPEVSLLKDYLSINVNDKTELVRKIFQHTHKLVKDTNFLSNNLNKAIVSNKATTLARANLMVALCRFNDIPARLVSGFILEENKPKKAYYWVEVYDETKFWQAYDPEKGYEAKVPNTYLTLDYDSPDIFVIENGKIVYTEYSITEDLDVLNVRSLESEKNLLSILDLKRLDFETKQSLTKLLILPFCVLLVAFIRHVLGFFPYGTFTAPILALAMVYAEMGVTLIIAGIIILLALLGRAILPKSLSRFARLSLIFTFVAMSMVFSVSVMAYFSMNMGGNIILLPTIILVSVVDRFYSYMDEVSAHAALIRLGVTVLIAIICIPLLEFERLGAFILNYPEAHLITAALVLTFSSYKFSKLTDHRLLKIFGENKKKKKAHTNEKDSHDD